MDLETDSGSSMEMDIRNDLDLRVRNMVTMFKRYLPLKLQAPYVFVRYRQFGLCSKDFFVQFF